MKRAPQEGLPFFKSTPLTSAAKPIGSAHNPPTSPWAELGAPELDRAWEMSLMSAQALRLAKGGWFNWAEDVLGCALPELALVIGGALDGRASPAL